jgi:hypothetical protein
VCATASWDDEGDERKSGLMGGLNGWRERGSGGGGGGGAIEQIAMEMGAAASQNNTDPTQSRVARRRRTETNYWQHTFLASLYLAT